MTVQTLEMNKLSSKSFRKTSCPKIISLFSGCGGLDFGFHKEGYKVVWANDNNIWAAKTFDKNFGKGIMRCQSIIDIDPYFDKSIPDCHIVIGGFPCQDFSMTWKRPGLDGERGSLYKEFLRFVDAKKPLAFIAENVKGILTANNNQAIKQIIEDFENVAPGYLIYPKLYNFADYGVPQFRERVLLVGIRMDTGFNFVHPKPTHGPKANASYFSSGESLENVENVIFNNEKMNLAPKTVKRLKKIPKGGNFTDISKDDPLYVKGLISHVYRRIDPTKPSMTVIAAGGGGTHGYHYPEPRALTNREKARLQTFPDDFVFVGNTAEVRRQIGNAVPPNGVSLVAKELKKMFEKQYTPIDLYEKSKLLKKVSIKCRIEIDK